MVSQPLYDRGPTQQSICSARSGDRDEVPTRDEGRANRLKRFRITRACDRCKKRKARCTGLQPCRQCDESSAICTYTAPYSRGRPVVPLAVPSQPHGPRRDHGVGASHSEAVTRTAALPRLLPTPSSHEAQSAGSEPEPRPDDSSIAVPELEPASRASPEPTHVDLEGHYVGPSSGLSFLLRVQKRIDSVGTFPDGMSNFSFGDAPLLYQPSASAEGPQPFFDPTFYLMLSREDTRRLIQRYFDFAVPVDRFLHRPTVESWLDEFYDTKGVMYDRQEAPARTAVLFMVFAVAQEHMDQKPSTVSAEMSTRYFLAADQQLSRKQGTVRLSRVQARLCQCLWLISQSRINHCWSLFGNVARLAVAIGLHRNRPAEAYNVGRVERECRRRTFWAAYSLDNYLSTALGRPRIFNDSDIDQELPSSIDDDDLCAGIETTLQRSTQDQSVMFGPVAYSILSRIVSGILRDVYSIRPPNLDDRCKLTAKYTRDLKEWRSKLSQFLDPNGYAAPLIPIFQRQRNVLNLAYWHTMILTHRHFVLSDFARLRNNRSRRSRHADDNLEAQREESVRECLQSAMGIVDTVDGMIRSKQFFRSFWFTPYFAFSATVILYIYTIQQREEPKESYAAYFDAAERCQKQLAGIAEEGSLTARYCLVLEELSKEATRQADTTHQHGRSNEDHSAGLSFGTAVQQGNTSTTAEQQTLLGTDFMGMMGMSGMPDFDVSPSDSLAGLTSWGQFDSMVISGFNGLESFLDPGHTL